MHSDTMSSSVSEFLESANREPWALLLGMGLVAGLALGRRPILALLVAGLGGTLLYQANRQRGSTQRHVGHSSIPCPSAAVDPVDEASWESFPASDPPSSY